MKKNCGLRSIPSLIYIRICFFFVCDSRISIKKYSKKLFHDFIQINHIHTKNTKHITYNKTIRHQYFRFIDFRSNSAFSLSSIIFPSGLPHSQEIFLSSTLNFIFQSRFSIYNKYANEIYGIHKNRRLF